VPHLTAYTRTSYITKDSPREVGQVTLVAKQPDCAAQSHGFENFNWEIKLPADQSEECAILLQPQLSPDVERNFKWMLPLT
jgi:hypothetical protein